MLIRNGCSVNLGGIKKYVIAPFRKSPHAGKGDIPLLTRKKSSSHLCNSLYACLNTSRGEHVSMSKQSKLMLDEGEFPYLWERCQ